MSDRATPSDPGAPGADRSGRGRVARRRPRDTSGLAGDPLQQLAAGTVPIRDLDPSGELSGDVPIDTAVAEADRRALFASLLAEDPFADEEPEPEGPEPYVTAVLVCHNGAAWLPTTLAALKAQLRAPDQVVAVDTGSSDDSLRITTRALGTTRVVRAAKETAYGAAVEAGLAATEVSATDRAERREWVWLLHDDSAPAVDALERMLSHAVRNPSLSVLGAKAVDWDHPDRLVDIGQSTDAAGRRETYLEPGEIDQGQHDQPRDVLAVGTAGALIRRETWDALDGFDPALPLLREDLDFGWRAARSGRRVAIVPSAELRHVRATLTGRREGALVPARVARVDRSHALYVSIVDGGSLGGLGRLPRVFAGVVLRSLVLLLTRRPVQALEESIAGLDVLFRPGRLIAGSRWRRRQFNVPARDTRPLLSRSSTRLRAVVLATTDRLSGSGELTAAGSHETGLDTDDTLPDEDTNVLRRAFVRPVFGLALVLAIVGLIADRHVLHGAGGLVGGRLLPVRAGAGDLWRAYGAGWHDVGAGSSSDASPWLPLLAVLSLPFGGNPAAAVTFVLLAAVPLSGVSAWYALRRRGLGTGLRCWGAATYALLPVVTETVAAGRFDALFAVIFAPLLIASGLRLQEGRSLNHAFALGLGIALVAAFSPPVWTISAVLLLSWQLLPGRSGVTRRARLHEVATALAALVVAPLLLLPWSASVLTHPRVLLIGLGGPGGLAAVPGRAVDAPSVLLLHPGPDALPLWVTVPLLLAALIAPLRTGRRRAAALAVAVALAGMLIGLWGARLGAAAGGRPPQGWSGVGLAVAGCGLVAATVVAAQRGRAALSGASFGLRQPGVVLLALAGLAVPFVAAGWLIASGLGGPLTRAPVSALPANVIDAATADPGQRVLWLRETGGEVSYSLGPVAGARLGDEDQRQNPTTAALLAHLVADLSSNRGTDAAEALSTFHVRYVAVDAAAAGTLPGILDRQPALSRDDVAGDAELWQLVVGSAQAQVLAGALAQAALHPAAPSSPLGRGPTVLQVAANPVQALTAGAEGARGTVTPAALQQVVVLADSVDRHWTARLDGRVLPRTTAWGWAQGFEVPPGAGGALVITYDTSPRHGGLWVQLAILLVVLVLAAPGARRIEDEPTGPVAATLHDDELWSIDELAQLPERVPPATPKEPGS
jgi:GT2 family glycosyltransferase